MTRSHGILWIDDEVMTGFGRTGQDFAYQHSPGVTPDLMAVGKGMVSAALPAGGVVMSRELAGLLDEYRWETVSTFAGHPVVAAAICANLEWVLEERVAERAASLGEHLGRRLRELEASHPCVAEVAGAGLLWAVELVRPDGSGERFVPEDRHALPAGPQRFSPSLFLARECAKHGVALATAPPNTLRLGPPLTTTPGAHRPGSRRAARARSTRSPRSAPRAPRPECGDRRGVSSARSPRSARGRAGGCASLAARPPHRRAASARGRRARRLRGRRHVRSRRPLHGERDRRAADASQADMERAIAAAQRAFETTTWASDPQFRAGCLRQLQQAMRDEAETLRRDLVAEVGCAVRMTYGDQLDRPIEKLGFYADLAEGYAYVRSCAAATARPGTGWPGAGGRRRSDHAVEHPDRARAREGRGGARRRVHRDPEAVTALAVVGDPSRPARRRAHRHPGRRLQRGVLVVAPRWPRC